MNDRILRSNPDKTNLLSPLRDDSRDNRASVQATTEHEPAEQRTMDTQDSTFTPESMLILQQLQKMQMDMDLRLKALKEDVQDQLTTRLCEMSARIESLVVRTEQSDGQRVQEVKITQEETKATAAPTGQAAPPDNGVNTIPEGMATTVTTPKQNYSLLRIAIDKQIDEIKPYFGKKMENVESWIKKIDKLAEIADIPDDEVFTLAKLKLQGDAEKWWENKKKEINSWMTLKSKLIDTFGPISKSSKLELEAFLHRRQQSLHESATKYWNDMMSHCTTYDENMSTQDRVWRIVNGALPEFRSKYENKVFDDEDQLLRALIQHEENRLRGTYEGQGQETQVSAVARGLRPAQDNAADGRQHPCDTVTPQVNVPQRPTSDNWPTTSQQPKGRPYNNNGRWNSSRPN